MADADTHRGDYSIVTRSVHALCGIEFVPRELPLGGPALPGSPLDPEQVCPSAVPPGSQAGERLGEVGAVPAGPRWACGKPSNDATRSTWLGSGDNECLGGDRLATSRPRLMASRRSSWTAAP
jgi:hypothetical protein